MLTELRTSSWSTRRSINILRIDLLTQGAIGNKWYKLRDNLATLAGQRVLTFGGAYSNHLYAFAVMAEQYRIDAIAVIRGEQPGGNRVLRVASRFGMQMHFVSRADYRRRHDPGYQTELVGSLGADAVLPEGGSNLAAVLGCKPIAAVVNRACGRAPTIAVSVGTGATFAGIVAGAEVDQPVLGVCVVNDPETSARVARWCRAAGERGLPVLLPAISRYAQPADNTLDFILQVFAESGIVLDPVYNGPVLERLLCGDLADTAAAADDLVFVHTGGLTGAWGMRERFMRVGDRRVVARYLAQVRAISRRTGLCGNPLPKTAAL